MATTAAFSLNLQRTFPASVERVWKAWTDPESVRQWYAPGAYSIPEIEMDVKQGGQYKIVMHNADTDSRQTLTGTYRDVQPERKLVYSWQWHTPNGASPDTLVTVTFDGSERETTVTVVHELFPDTDMRDKHINGWTACLDQLKPLV